MKDWIEDALGAVCLFAIGYGAFFVGHGLGF
jgi:hypothetical protein